MSSIRVGIIKVIFFLLRWTHGSCVSVLYLYIVSYCIHPSKKVGYGTTRNWRCQVISLHLMIPSSLCAPSNTHKGFNLPPLRRTRETIRFSDLSECPTRWDQSATSGSAPGFSASTAPPPAHQDTRWEEFSSAHTSDQHGGRM